MNRQGARVRVLLAIGLVALLVGAAVSPATAEEVKGKWRFEFQVGGTDPGDSIPSDGNRIQVIDAMSLQGEPQIYYLRDPRPGWMAGNEARISTDTYFEVRASYGLAAWKNMELVLDMGVGYSTGSIDNLELAYAADFEDGSFSTLPGATNTCETLKAWGLQPQPWLNCIPFASTSPVFDKWHGELLSGGELTMYPVSIGLYARFRPTKTFNPYIGVNVGYLLVDFEPSDEWKRFQDQMDASLVDYVVRSDWGALYRELAGAADAPDGLSEGHDLKRPRIDTPNSAFFELRGGAEWQFNPKAAVFVEMRYSWMQDNIDITVDGRHDFGTPLKSGRYDAENPVAGPPGGRPAYIITGGLVRELTDPSGTHTSDGPHPGEYFFNGGTLDYGGWTFTAGIRFSL